ncbi:MAG: response regulator transcription factor [Phycisphaeraceae bacterium]|nr:MAG: response regulator transcription factor [Phycisphaeraceae bacterium]
MMPNRVLIVEDDPSIRAGLRDALELTGYAVREAGDGRAGLNGALSGEVDLVLLDIMLPEIDGLHVLERVRAEKPGLPVICLTALGEQADRVRGLKAGADDYIVKPFGLDELLARVEAVLRRSAPPTPAAASDGTFTLNGRTINLARQEVTLESGETRVLPLREAEVLGYLTEHRGRAISREELLERVWGIDPRGMQTRSVDMAVARLRDQLGDAGPEHRVIVTVRGRGYMLAGEA